jgi:hypothetical protein
VVENNFTFKNLSLMDTFGHSKRFLNLLYSFCNKKKKCQDLPAIYFHIIIYQGTDILPEIFSSSPDTRVFVARKLHEGASPRVIFSDKHECWTARNNFWRYISVPRYIRKRIARKNFSLA